MVVDRQSDPCPQDGQKRSFFPAPHRATDLAGEGIATCRVPGPFPLHDIPPF
jgi:hypothetical protein